MKQYLNGKLIFHISLPGYFLLNFFLCCWCQKWWKCENDYFNNMKSFYWASSLLKAFCVLFTHRKTKCCGVFISINYIEYGQSVIWLVTFNRGYVTEEGNYSESFQRVFIINPSSKMDCNLSLVLRENTLKLVAAYRNCTVFCHVNIFYTLGQ